MTETELNHSKEVSKLLDEVSKLYDAVLNEGQMIFEKHQDAIERESFIPSAKNLSHYLALRQRDIRHLQKELVPWGLSSLGRLESKTLSTLEAVINALAAISQTKSSVIDPEQETFSFGEERLAANTKAILGKKPRKRNTAIMVTMPTEAASDLNLVKDLIDAGMNVARINCAHDQKKVWNQIIGNIHQLSQETGKKVKILMDIAGPKIRTDWVFTTHKKAKVKVDDIICLTKNYETLPLDQPKVKVTVGCSVPQIFESLKIGDKVLIDDGSVETEVSSIDTESAYLKVKRVNGKSINIKAEKGLNFPGVYFNIEILTDKDKQDIEFACQHADIIGCSFVRTSEDVEAIQAELGRVLGDKANEMPLMAKIETVQAVNHLPQIIFTAASKNPFSVMIARGDLAVETGYIRLAEVQQQIMWFCEAADVPVVWGTEVLANMIDTGIPSRAEVTDAAEGARTECVMLNKGPYIVETVSTLDEILKTMREHQFKKTPKLRALSIAQKINQ